LSDRFAELTRRLAEIHDVEKSAGVLSWDEETKMPPSGADARAEQRATLNRIAHELNVSPELGDLLEELRPFEEQHDFESFEASLIRVARHDYEKAIRVPPQLRAEMTRAGSQGYQGWLRAREQEDYAIMLPHLERNLELRRQYVACFEPTGDPYDIVLDDYEPGMKTEEVVTTGSRTRCFRGCGRWMTPSRSTIRACAAASTAPPSDASPSAYSRNGEWTGRRGALTARCIRSRLRSRRRTSGSRRTSTRTRCTESSRAFTSSATRSPLAQGVSSAFHESQSRMWENLVGRNLATWRHFYPRLQEAFPAQFGDVSLESFHRALNKVQPSFRRVDADEVTYCLHIILRFELERALLSGELSLVDLPEAFNAKMREYLGLQPPDVVVGVLQDVHWSDMTMGYFPTYALGNVVSVQLWERAEADLGGLDDQFERGEFDALRDWLRENVHRHGRAFTPQELLQRVTGSAMNPAPYLHYLERKLGELFGVAVA
jgi:carboxypeptidase Taq